MFERNKNVESFSKEIEDIMKKQMEILELESIIIEKKNFLKEKYTKNLKQQKQVSTILSITQVSTVRIDSTK